MASLRSLLNLLADQEALLRALLEAPDGLTQTELQARLPAGESVSAGALKRLTELGVVEERPGESLSRPAPESSGYTRTAHHLPHPPESRMLKAAIILLLLAPWAWRLARP